MTTIMPTYWHFIPRRRACLAFFCVAVVASAESSPPDSQPPILPAPDLQPPESTSEEVKTLLRRYFLEATGAPSKSLESDIHVALEGDMDALRKILPTLDLWEPVEPGRRELAVDGAPGCEVWIPDGYDPAAPRPVTFLLDVNRTRDGTPRVLDAAEGHILVVPHDVTPLGFHAPPEKFNHLQQWLHALKRGFHVDSSRVYLHGRGVGGDSAWYVALFAPRAFAGVHLEASALRVPYRKAFQPLLLENLKRTPLQLEWTNAPLPPGEILSGRDVTVSLVNWSIVASAEQLKLPLTWRITSDGVPRPPESTGRVDELQVSTLLPVEHWFRYPSQSPRGWVRVGDMTEPLWIGDQIDVLPRRGGDANDVAKRLFQERMGRVTGRVTGQHIELSTQKCQDVTLHLPFDALDYSQPVTIVYNQVRRFEGRLTPSLRTMLQSARDDFEFDRPACVRVRIGDRGRVIPY